MEYLKKLKAPEGGWLEESKVVEIVRKTKNAVIYSVGGTDLKNALQEGVRNYLTSLDAIPRKTNGCFWYKEDVYFVVVKAKSRNDVVVRYRKFRLPETPSEGEEDWQVQDFG